MIRDDSPVRPDEPGRPVTAANHILELVGEARTRADDLDAENTRTDVDVLIFDLGIALDHAVALADDLDLENALTLTRALDRVLDLDLDGRCEQQHRIVTNLRSARTYGEELAVTLTTVHGAHRTETIDRQPVRVALELTRVAVRTLPAAHRSRYYEEFRAELARQSRSGQLGYALRLLTRCGQLRRALADAASVPRRDR